MTIATASTHPITDDPEQPRFPALALLVAAAEAKLVQPSPLPPPAIMTTSETAGAQPARIPKSAYRYD